MVTWVSENNQKCYLSVLFQTQKHVGSWHCVRRPYDYKTNDIVTHLHQNHDISGRVVRFFVTCTQQILNHDTLSFVVRVVVTRPPLSSMRTLVFWSSECRNQNIKWTRNVKNGAVLIWDSKRNFGELNIYFSKSVHCGNINSYKANCRFQYGQ